MNFVFDDKSISAMTARYSSRRRYDLLADVQPHLVVGDVEAGQRLIPSISRRISELTRLLSAARRGLKKYAAGGGLPPFGLPPARRQTTPGPFSS